MDLVQGVKRIYVITQHTTRNGDPKLVERCSYPLTGPGVVSRIFTDLAVVDVTPAGFQLVELAPGEAKRAMLVAGKAQEDQAAGLMDYVVVEELIPESQLNKNTDTATVGAD